MSTLHVNTLDTQSGTEIALTTGKAITGTAAQFKITGGTSQQLIQTDGAGGLSFVNSPGANNVMNKNATYSLTTADVQGTPTTIVTCQATTGSVVISLPSVTDMLGRVVRVVLTAVNTTANYALRVTNSTGMTELWQGFDKHDFVEFTSDGTNINMIDCQTTVRGRMYMFTDSSFTSQAILFNSSGHTSIDYNVGNWLPGTTGRVTATFECDLLCEMNIVQGYTTHGDGAGWSIWKNGSVYCTGFGTYAGGAQYNWFTESISETIHLQKDDYIEFYNWMTSTGTWYGTTDGWKSSAKWTVTKRYGT